MTASRATWGRRLGVLVLILAAGAWAQAAVLHADETPGVPGGLTAIALDGSVGLAWQDADGATSYRVYRGTDAAHVDTLIASPTATRYTDPTATNATKYFYAVRAANGAGASDPGQLAAAEPRAATCDGDNAVAQENCFPGDTGWKTTDAGRTYDDGIEGYATAASVNAGGSVDLKVDTANADVPFHVDIYRTGWYGGDQGRLVSTIPAREATWQPECVSDPGTTGTTDCSGWSAKATVTTTTDWPSGVYLLKLTREDNDAHGEIVLVVRDDGSHSQLAYKVPTNTYQAYNNWGGKSIYDFNSSTGDTALAHGPRAVKVSYDRPYAQAWTGDFMRDYYPRTDVAAVSWLERQGYDVSYLADPDVDRDPDQLQDHRIVISGVHDEYWTQGIRDAFAAARDHGTSLVFLGANASYWRARYEAGSDRRTLVEYKTTQGGDPDPDGPTATWRDPAGPNQPENALIGQMYAGDNSSAAWGLKVSGAEGRDRVWRHTTLGDQAADATTTLGTGLVGWEWDKRVANGEEPAGVKTLASTPVDGGIAQGSGAANTPGATTQMSTIYTAPSGALVFDTGTNFWSRGLAPNVDGTEDANGRIRQATANVLADMGAVATTPDPALTFDEPGPPQVTGGAPAAGETGVAPTAAITATFDRELDPSTVDGDSVTLETGDAAVAADVAWDRATRTITVTPDALLAANALYTLTLGTGLRSWAGDGLAAAVTRSFTPGAGAPPTLTATTPADGATTVPVDASVTATANRALDPDTVTASTATLRAGAAAPVAAAVAYDAETRTIALAPDAALTEATTYTVTLDGVQAEGGAPLATTSWTFTTSTNLSVSAQSPAPLATGVSPSADVRVTFSRAIDAATLTAERVALDDADGDAVAAQLSYDPTTRTATLTPSAPLAVLANYRVRVAAGIRAADGAPIDPTLWWFSTAPSAPSAPTVTALLPAAGAGEAFNGTAVKATFDRDLAAATVTGQSFTLTTATGAPVAATVAYDAVRRQAVLRPLAQLATDATYTATLSTAIAEPNGTPLGAPVTWTFTTARCPCSLLAGQTPAETGLSGTFELGVRVTSQADADLVAVRFYKSPGETGTHVGRVWNAAGQLLGQATFANETASGWQRQPLATPVALTAGQVYTVSVNANSKWAKTGWSMRDPIASGPLSSLADGTNGVYNDAPGLFPASSYQWTNYFIDPVVRLATAPARVPQVTSIVPAAGATGVATSAPVRISFTQPLDESTIDASSVRLTDAASTAVPAALSYDDDTRTVTLTPSASLTAGATYTVRLSTALRSDDDTPLAAAVTSTFATASAVIAPTVASTAPAQGATGMAIGTAPSLTFDQRMDPATLTGATVALTGPGGAVATTLGVSGDGRTVTATPTAPLAEAATYTLTVTTGAHSDTGAALANPYNLVFTTGSSCPCRLWGGNPTPAASTLDTSNGRSGGGPYSLELGVKFHVSRAATLTGVRFYKDPWETDGHTARLWTSDGTPVASVAFGAESNQGWQRVALSTPASLTAGQTYVLSVGVNSKFGMSANSALGAGVSDGPLSSVVDGANGVYADAAGTFPTQTWGNSNYFIDPEVQ
ncbi:hypothetical protein DSM104299_04573 [Baekduia alba]|uniref:Ig-like domain-containing protein n=1 Tax=Baekduia alba TaxID=2997333 RepID=UPI002340998B|nr:Ig-like domain-containing protein [Baekduia alba]WCB95822.1 hypothetical protein DSM104299_04573 [Baekduia alba]